MRETSFVNLSEFVKLYFIKVSFINNSFDSDVFLFSKRKIMRSDHIIVFNS